MTTACDGSSPRAGLSPDGSGQGHGDMRRDAAYRYAHVERTFSVFLLPAWGQPDGNSWISYVLSSVDPNGPNYDPVDAQLLGQGSAALLLDLDRGQPPKTNGTALKAGSDRAKRQLLVAAGIKDGRGAQRDAVSSDPGSGIVTFRIQNNAGQTLFSGYPEGRRMFVNIRLYDAINALICEINPYCYAVGVIKGLPNAPSGPNEAYVDIPVHEAHMSSSFEQ